MCGPQLAGMETAIWQVYQNEDFVLIGINRAENQNLVQTFVENLGLTFPIGLGDMSLYNLYELEGGMSPFPRDFIVDQQGVIQYAQTEYDPQAMTDLIETLLGVTDIPDNLIKDVLMPLQPHLHPPYPNPFNSEVKISFWVPTRTKVSLGIYDVLGRQVKSLITAESQNGYHQIHWDGTGSNDIQVSSGTYFVKFWGNGFEQTQQVVVLK